MKGTLVWDLLVAIRTVATPFALNLDFRGAEKSLLGLLVTHKGSIAPNKQDLWQQLYPERPFHAGTFDNLASDALEYLYQQLAIKGLQEDPVAEGLLRTNQLRALGLEKQAKRQLQRTATLLEKGRQRSFAFHQQRFQLAELADQLALRQRRQQTLQLQAAADALDQTYLINKLRLACDMVSRENVVSGQYDFRHLDFLLLEFSDDLQDAEHYPIAGLYYQVYQFLTAVQADTDDYQKTKTLVQAHAQLLPQNEELTVYNYLLNYCVGKINRGDRSYYSEILELYQLLLDRDLLIEDGYLSQWAYLNIATAGLRQEAFDWTATFLNDYKAQLPPAAQANAYRYNMASLEFERANFDQALSTLGEIVFTDAFYYISAKLIQLKVYYHQGAYGPLQSTAESARLYLLRNRQLSEYQRRSIKAFLRYIQQLAQWKKELPYRKQEQSDLRHTKLLQKIQSQQELVQRDWLLGELSKKV